MLSIWDAATEETDRGDRRHSIRLKIGSRVLLDSYTKIPQLKNKITKPWIISTWRMDDCTMYCTYSHSSARPSCTLGRSSAPSPALKIDLVGVFHTQNGCNPPFLKIGCARVLLDCSSAQWVVPIPNLIASPIGIWNPFLASAPRLAAPRQERNIYWRTIQPGCGDELHQTRGKVVF